MYSIRNRFVVGSLVCAFILNASVGCNSKSSESVAKKGQKNRPSQSKIESAEKTESPQVAGADQDLTSELSNNQERFELKDSPAANEAAAQKLYDSFQAKFKTDIASFREKLSSDLTDQEKNEFFVKNNPIPAYANNLVKIVKSYPEADVCMDVAMTAAGMGNAQQKNECMCYVFENCSDRLNYPMVIDSLLKEVPSPTVENWIRLLIHHSSKGINRAESLLAFKTFFDQIPEFRKALKYNPHIVKKLSDEQVAFINSDINEVQETEIAKYLQEIIDDYRDLKYTKQGLGASDTFGEVAIHELFELKNLRVGKVAPEIEGVDLDGTPFKLSDYRGKVVMLDFWGHWCFPCRQMYPHERKLVMQLNGMPFSLVGVNSDRKLKTAQNAVKNDRLGWRNYWIGPEGTAAPIAKQWNVSEWPTVYLIDANGVIRYKGVQGNELNEGIQTLMAEMGYNVDLSRTVKLASSK